jgi:hypothetical protein
MRERIAQYDIMDRSAIIVKTMAPAVDAALDITMVGL